MHNPAKIAVIIPCYKVRKHIVKVVKGIGPEVTGIYVVDDACPEDSGRFLAQNCRDPRLKIIYQDCNSGVGGATLRGFSQATQDGYDILVKLDGDGQMDSNLISCLTEPVCVGEADYAKGNRFFSPRTLKKMPKIRLFGNGVLSFVTKVSSGYWNIMDPTNGFIAIHARAFRLLDHAQIERRYFFESDMLYRLHLLNAVVVDVPMNAIYEDEVSSLKISQIIGQFMINHLNRFFKRITYEYFVREINIGSTQIVAGTFSLVFALIYGGYFWISGIREGHANQPGVIVISAVALILGIQFLLSALNFDISRRQAFPIHLLPEKGIRHQKLSSSPDHKSPGALASTDPQESRKIH